MALSFDELIRIVDAEWTNKQSHSITYSTIQRSNVAWWDGSVIHEPAIPQDTVEEVNFDEAEG